jgi:2-alkyl-3-oxoalkanoate reductase
MNNNANNDTRRQRNVLVTGGGGFLGKAIVKKLLERGDRVTSFSRGFYPELESMGVEQVQGDIASSFAVDKACRGMDVVFHVAAKSGMWGRYSEYYKTNVRGTENVIHKCRANGVQSLIYTSSPSAILNGEDLEGIDESMPYPKIFSSHYSRSKALAEQAVAIASGGGLKTIILRPHIIMGPGDNTLVPRIMRRAGRMVRIGNGKNLIDTIFIDNAADAHIMAADSLEKKPELSGRIYFITQNEPVNLWELINELLLMAGRGPVKGAISHKTAMMLASSLEFIYKFLRIKREPLVTRYAVHELSTSHWFDTEAARRDLGFIPKVSLEDAKKYLKEWVVEEFGAKKILTEA